jgi:energy-coupling factor transporter ATP-binding protein EcfA2
MAFQFKPAIREQTPLLVGLIGPSGCGKTYSALRLATGIQKVRGGKIVGVDTEARRMLHYADKFKFSYCEFGAPFSSERYREMLREAAAEAAGGVVIVDSMSHEHEGEGGCLEFHEAELTRIAGSDYKKREKCTMLAWAQPKAQRRKLINALLQINCAFVFCFRAKEKLKIRRGEEPLPLGWQAIAGDEFAYEMTTRCLLPPGCQGVPDWSDAAFAMGVPKLMSDHSDILPDGVQIDESIGERLAKWAAGGAPAAAATMPNNAKLLAAFAAIGVTLPQLETAMGKPQGEWTEADVAAARSLYAARKKAASETPTDADTIPPDEQSRILAQEQAEAKGAA